MTEEQRSIEDLVHAVRELEPQNCPTELAHTRARLAFALREAGRPAESLAVEREALTYYLSVDAHGLAAACMFSMGMTFEDLGEPYYAIAAYRRGAERARREGDEEFATILTEQADACEAEARAATIAEAVADGPRD